METMRFGGALLRILKQVLTSDPRLGTVYLSKVDLADAYMRLWVRMEDVLPAPFLIPKKTPIGTQLVGFHLSLPMGYINISPYFGMTTETVANLANESIYQREQAGERPIRAGSQIQSGRQRRRPCGSGGRHLGTPPSGAALRRKSQC